MVFFAADTSTLGPGFAPQIFPHGWSSLPTGLTAKRKAKRKFPPCTLLFFLPAVRVLTHRMTTVFACRSCCLCGMPNPFSNDSVRAWSGVGRDFFPEMMKCICEKFCPRFACFSVWRDMLKRYSLAAHAASAVSLRDALSHDSRE